jgi:hypothetical protein
MDSKTKVQIATELQKLALLGLAWTPSGDVIAGTVKAWVSVFDDRDWRASRDSVRIAAAFHTLATTCTQWPSPRQFLDALRPAAVSTKLSTPLLSNDRINEVGAQHVKEILTKLHVEPTS